MNQTPEYLSGLNEPQREAVLHTSGPVLVLAGAGSGKTRVLTTRVAHLIAEHGVRGDEILAVTFTNKAAREMRERIERITGKGAGVQMGTFHAFGASFLRKHAPAAGLNERFTILDSDESTRVMRAVLKDLEMDEVSAREAHRKISTAKNSLLKADDIRRRGQGGAMMARAWSEYDNRLKTMNSVDFDDLLILPVRILQKSEDLGLAYKQKYQYVLVDEYQDTNIAQHALLGLLTGTERNIMVVGDDDQSIYAFRGADVGNILGFDREYEGAKVIRLEENYRSTGPILELANRVISRNSGRLGKILWTSVPGGETPGLTVCESDRAEATVVSGIIQSALDSGVASKEIAVLYRTNAQSRLLEAAFRTSDIKYRLVGGLTFYARQEVKDVLAYIRLISNHQDGTAFLRAIAAPRRGIGESSIASLMNAAQDGEGGIDVAARAGTVAGVSRRGAEALENLASLIRTETRRVQPGSVAGTVRRIVEGSGLMEWYARDEDTSPDRKENVDQLINQAAELDDDLGEESTVERFLEYAALSTSADEGREDMVTLMTLHASKGLEFDTIVLCGVEDRLLPHGSARETSGGEEEERRLFYVGITRAKKHLSLTAARTRRTEGIEEPRDVSPFLQGIDKSVLLRNNALFENQWRQERKPRNGTWKPRDEQKATKGLTGRRVMVAGEGQGIVKLVLDGSCVVLLDSGVKKVVRAEQVLVI